MHYKSSFSRKVFLVCNSCIIILVCVMCLFPILHTLALSLSSASAAAAGKVFLLPVDFQLDAYKRVMEDKTFLTSFFISVKRVVLGLGVNLTMTVLAGYPLSKTKEQFPMRNFYMGLFIVTWLFWGGLIPTYLVIKWTGLIDTIWALILPGAVSANYVILLQNYFKSLPDEIYDSARVDGAGEWVILFRIFLPLAKPILAVLVVYIVVAHWNSWFDGMLYMNDASNYPLQTYLQTIIVEIDPKEVFNVKQVMNVNTRNMKAAQIFVAMVPVLCVYPFAQKHFVKGIVMGSVKG